jgi:hypothetical protein
MEDAEPIRPAGTTELSASDWLATAGPEVGEDQVAVHHQPPIKRGEPIPSEFCFPDGTPNPYAVMCENRRRADTFYLEAFSMLGDHDQAADGTCEVYGHDARASRCLRCGRGVRVTGGRRGG